VSEVHEIYYEQCGNPKGRPVVFLHGGPGGGLVPEYRQFFDPSAYRIVLFDQRGSGKARRTHLWKTTRTWHLVSDIEKLREHFGHREVAGVRRIVGQHAGARLRREARQSRD